MAAELIDTVIVFVIALLVGALALYVGARVITGTDDFTYALVTALIASLVLSVVSFLVGWIPLLGPLLALVVYLGVINWRYPGGWLKAAGVAVVAWLTTVVVLYVLSLLNVVSPRAIGILGA